MRTLLDAGGLVPNSNDHRENLGYAAIAMSGKKQPGVRLLGLMTLMLPFVSTSM
jgi:hypothetical protein